MAQPASTPKIDELRIRIKADPKSRLFFPLAEELRKVQQLGEAEQVLRQGLSIHPTYLSAWVSLGRICREQGKNDAAVESLSKALVLDPGNVVAARLLADAYLALGQKVEAIKKYKLVHALLPADQELEAVIERLDREINPPAEPPPASVASEEPAEDLGPMPTMETPFGDTFPSPDAAPFPQSEGDRVFADAAASVAEEQRMEIATGDDEPMAAAHAESPFEEPAADSGYGSDAFAIEQPAGMHIESAPMAAALAEAPGDVFGDETETGAEDFYAPASERPRTVDREEAHIETGIASDLPFALESTLAPPPADDFAKTITMADLYAGQGLVDEARDIYEDILARDPENASVRAKLEALSSVVPGASPPEEADYPYDDEQAPQPPPAHELPQGGPDAAAGTSAAVFAAPVSDALATPEREELAVPGAKGSALSGADPFGTSAPDALAEPEPFAESFAPLADPRDSAPSGVRAEQDAPMAAAAPSAAATPNREKIARLEQWLAKMGRREVGHVQ